MIPQVWFPNSNLCLEGRPQLVRSFGGFWNNMPTNSELLSSCWRMPNSPILQFFCRYQKPDFISHQRSGKTSLWQQRNCIKYRSKPACMGLSCVQGPGRPWHELTSWCTGGCRCPPGAAACWVLSCCGQRIFSHCGRRCQGSRSYWPAGCSGEVSSWDHRTSASRLSTTAGKRHQWCIPLWRKERKISLVLLNSSSKCFKKW